LQDVTNPHLVATLFKQFLMNLPEPIFPFDSFDEALLAVGEEDFYVRRNKMRELVASLPPLHFNPLLYLMTFLYVLTLHSSLNLMDPHNLGLIFAPSLLRKRVEAVDDFMKFQRSSLVVEVMIDDFVGIFDDMVSEKLQKMKDDGDIFAVLDEQTPREARYKHLLMLTPEEKSKVMSYNKARQNRAKASASALYNSQPKKLKKDKISKKSLFGNSHTIRARKKKMKKGGKKKKEGESVEGTPLSSKKSRRLSLTLSSKEAKGFKEQNKQNHFTVTDIDQLKSRSFTSPIAVDEKVRMLKKRNQRNPRRASMGINTELVLAGLRSYGKAEKEKFDPKSSVAGDIHSFNKLSFHQSDQKEANMVLELEKQCLIEEIKQMEATKSNLVQETNLQKEKLRELHSVAKELGDEIFGLKKQVEELKSSEVDLHQTQQLSTSTNEIIEILSVLQNDVTELKKGRGSKRNSCGGHDCCCWHSYPLFYPNSLPFYANLQNDNDKQEHTNKEQPIIALNPILNSSSQLNPTCIQQHHQHNESLVSKVDTLNQQHTQSVQFHKTEDKKELEKGNSEVEFENEKLELEELEKEELKEVGKEVEVETEEEEGGKEEEEVEEVEEKEETEEVEEVEENVEKEEVEEYKTKREQQSVSVESKIEQLRKHHLQNQQELRAMQVQQLQAVMPSLSALIQEQCNTLRDVQQEQMAFMSSVFGLDILDSKLQ